MPSQHEDNRKFHHLVIEHINAQSVVGNLDEIRHLIKERSIDILTVSETWLTPVVPDRYINITNFDVFRHDLKPGGGVCIYVRSDLKVTKIELDVENDSLVEDLCS